MRTYFYIIKHAVKPEHKIHVLTFYIPMYQCAVSRNAAFFYAPFLSHLFVFKIHTSVSRLFHKISFDFKSPSKIDSSHFDFHTQTTFPIRDPISTLQSGRKIFLF